MATGDNTTDSIIWFPGEEKGHNPGGEEVNPPDQNNGGAEEVTADNTVDPPFPMTNLRSAVLADLGGGDVGMGLIVQQLGPFPFAFDTPDIWSDGSPGQAKLADLAIGTIVFKVWAEITTAFDGHNDFGNDLAILIGTGGPGWNAGQWVLQWVGQANAAQSGNGYRTEQSIVGSPSVARPGGNVARLTDAGALVVAYNGADATQGAGDVYALIATPAS